ncbi:MAG: Arsenical resistance operon repressor [Patescibacteria group bacterium]|nr:Arsenical resistance operon repressor [Patescibacteria group bacterium]
MDDKLAQYYRVLSNPVRLRVFMHIADKSAGFAPTTKEESCISEISRTVGIPQPTASNHVKALKKVGLVKSTSVGTRCYHYVTKDAATYLLDQTKYIYDQAHRNPY